MTLVRRQKGEMTPLPDGVVARVQLSPYRIQLAGIRTSTVEYRRLDVPRFGEFEGQNGTRLFNVVVENTDPELVFFEQDIFWAHVGQSDFPGFRPHEYPWNMPERFPLFHVKDGLRNGGPHEGWTMTDVGAGDIAYEPYFCGLNPLNHQFLMENDDAAQEVGGSFADAERSYDYMAGLRERHA